MRRRAAVVVTAIALSAIAGTITAHRDVARAGDEREIPVARDFARLLPAYPHAHFHAAGDTLHVDGASRFMAYAETDDPPERVLERYTQLLEQRGLLVTRRGDGLVAVSIDDRWRRTVIASRSGHGTLIVASVSQSQPHLAKARLPLPPGCVVAESAGSRDSGTVRENVQFACDGYADEVIGYYDGLMGEPVHVQADDQTRVTRYERDGDDVLLVTTQTLGEVPRVVAVLHWETR